ncbi:MAG: RNA-binding S4 domain-containing protein [Pseudomonadota bacterium]
MSGSPRPTIRLDKWLWFARFFKTRGLAAKQVSGGHVRVNGTRVAKPAHAVGPGDTLTFPQGNRIRVAEILAVGARRGPAPEAQALYRDVSPQPDPSTEGKATLYLRVGARPTKKDRRRTDQMRGRSLE